MLPAAAQRIAEVVSQRIRIELDDGRVLVVAHDCLQDAVLQKNLRTPIEIEIPLLAAGARLQPIQARFEIDDGVVDRTSQMRKIESAEQAMPVRVVGLRLIEQRSELAV